MDGRMIDRPEGDVPQRHIVFPVLLPFNATWFVTMERHIYVLATRIQRGCAIFEYRYQDP